MSERIFPSIDTIKGSKQPLTEGEDVLLNYLDENLQRDNNFKNINEINENNVSEYNGWVIFVQPFLNGCRPDIILFHPRIGIQIIEVKDWNLNNYTINDGDFYVSNRNGTCLIKSPIKQVEYYKEKLTGQLIPQIGEEFDQNKKRYGLIKTSIYFHKSSTVEAQGFLKQTGVNYSYFPVFGRDELNNQNLKKIVPDSYLSQSYYWNEKWNKEILFWLKPPFHSLEQTIRLSLNRYQRNFSEPQTGHHRVRGVAGSGKTQVLAYRAGSLASQGFRVLILSFNITLWHYIRDMIQRSPFEFNWDRFTFNHFHGFCKDILNEFGEKWPADAGHDEAIFRSVVPNKVLEIIQRGSYEKYDVILIDEGQDYYIEWYQMLCKFLTSRDEVVVVCDKKQNIYGRETEWLDKRRIGVEKFGEWIELKTIVRLPERIANIAREFSEVYNLNQDVRVDNIERPDLFNQYQEHSIWWNINEEDWLTKIDEAFEIIKINGTSNHISDTVILLPNKDVGLKCVSYFEGEKGIQVNHVFEKDDQKKYHRSKKAFWMGDSRLKISTIYSFKGWEVLNVILFIPYKTFENQDLLNRIVYTAITRTRQNLIVINANDTYKEFGAKITTSWK